MFNRVTLLTNASGGTVIELSSEKCCFEEYKLLTALSRSQSSMTTKGDLPPSSRDTRFKLDLAAAAMINLWTVTFCEIDRELFDSKTKTKSPASSS